MERFLLSCLNVTWTYENCRFFSNDASIHSTKALGLDRRLASLEVMFYRSYYVLH